MSANDGSSFLVYQGRKETEGDGAPSDGTKPPPGCRRSTPSAPYVPLAWEDDWRDPPDPRVACSFQKCIRWPSGRSMWKDLPGSPIRLGAVKHLLGRFPSDRAPRRSSGSGHSRPCSRGAWIVFAARLALSPNWLKSRFVQGWFGSSAHSFMPGKRLTFLRAGPLALFRLGRHGFVEPSPLGWTWLMR